MNYKLLTTNYKLKIAWLYPELMSTYGDRGNVIVLQKIAESNGIEFEIMRIDQNLNSQISNLKSADLIFMGGAQDLQQEIVNKDLLENKGTIFPQCKHKFGFIQYLSLAVIFSIYKYN
jgi:CobQ-like glutamine amidotransferase family enzyme